jgi:hypothetical protein
MGKGIDAKKAPNFPEGRHGLFINYCSLELVSEDYEI